MENKTIISVGKFFFWLSFILGNICLFGYIITKNDEFAAAGCFVLIFGTLINMVAILGLLVFGFINKSQLKSCLKASLFICINIPIAILYFYIGTSLLKL